LKCDVIILGAGIVGISTALHLQARGRSVVLVDRREPASETSYGNAGVIQRESIYRYGFPRSLIKIAKYGSNQLTEARVHWPSVPWLVPILFNYWRRSTPELMDRSARAMWAITEGCFVEHQSLMDEAEIPDVARRTGYLKLYRRTEALESALQVEETARRRFGASYVPVDSKRLQQLEPDIRGDFAGGIWLPNHLSVADPGGLGKAYANLFERRGGRFLKADAGALERTGNQWLLPGHEIAVSAPDVVVALGPWSDVLLARFGIRIPLGVKRGYHMHFKAGNNAKLNRPVVDAEYGYVLSEMKNGVRLTTGAEFALRDSPPTPYQLRRVEPVAKTLFPLTDRIEPRPWLGARPYLPDLVPMIGQVPGHRGFWVNFGHHHLGFTTGPASGRLLAEMITGAQTFADTAPYRVDRFSHQA
jgi:D-amino-acid dehydrogenase